MAIAVQEQSEQSHRLTSTLLLEYRSESDFDIEFIAKTIVGFAAGAMVFGFILNFSESLYIDHSWSRSANTMLIRFAMSIGFVGLACSLLLVTLKARADHTAAFLYHKNWLNPIVTGGLFATLIWGPWILFEQGLVTNPYLLAFLWTLVMMYPVLAALWVVGPHKERVCA